MQLSQNFVSVILHLQKQHKENEVVVGRETRKSCSLYPSIACDDHVAVYNKADNAFADVKGTPTTIIAGPDAKEMARIVGNKGGEITKAMEEAIKKVGPGIPLAQWQKTKAELAAADELLAAGKAKKAIDILSKYAKAKNDVLKEMAEAGLKKANEAGLKAIEEAQAIEDGAEKAKALKKVSEEYKGTEAGDKAKEALEPPK